MTITAPATTARVDITTRRASDDERGPLNVSGGMFMHTAHDVILDGDIVGTVFTGTTSGRTGSWESAIAPSTDLPGQWFPTVTHVNLRGAIVAVLIRHAGLGKAEVHAAIDGEGAPRFAEFLNPEPTGYTRADVLHAESAAEDKAEQRRDDVGYDYWNDRA